MTSAILVLMFSATLIRVLLGAKFKFVVLLSTMLIVSNLANLIVVWSDEEFYKYFSSNDS